MAVIPRVVLVSLGAGPYMEDGHMTPPAPRKQKWHVIPCLGHDTCQLQHRTLVARDGCVCPWRCERNRLILESEIFVCVDIDDKYGQGGIQPSRQQSEILSCAIFGVFRELCTGHGQSRIRRNKFRVGALQMTVYAQPDHLPLDSPLSA